MYQTVNTHRFSTQGRSVPFTQQRPRARLQIVNALTRGKKEEIVTTLKENLSGSIIAFGVRFNGLDVPTMQKFRRGIPEKSKVLVCKNNLMKVACKDTPGWSIVSDKGLQGENAWVFVHEDDIGASIKHYFKFENDLFEEAKKVAPKGAEVTAPTSLSTIVMDNRYLTADELKRCESLPTKKQLYTMVARMLKKPARKIAVGVKSVPTKLAVALKRVSELDEDKTKTLAEVVKTLDA